MTCISLGPETENELLPKQAARLQDLDNRKRSKIRRLEPAKTGPSSSSQRTNVTLVEETSGAGSQPLSAIEVISLRLKALGDPTRLAIYQALRTCQWPVSISECGDVRHITGPTVGEICCKVTGAAKPTSSFSFHLKVLKDAGLIVTERKGTNILCGINQAAHESLVTYISGGETSCDSCD